MTVTKYIHCECGGGMKVESSPKAVAKAERLFWRVHSDPGCGPCDAKTSRLARQAADAKDNAERVIED